MTDTRNPDKTLEEAVALVRTGKYVMLENGTVAVPMKGRTDGRITLSQPDGRSVNVVIPKLVMALKEPMPYAGAEVEFIDGDANNWHPGNLRWAEQKEAPAPKNLRSNQVKPELQKAIFYDRVVRNKPLLEVAKSYGMSGHMIQRVVHNVTREIAIKSVGASR